MASLCCGERALDDEMLDAVRGEAERSDSSGDESMTIGPQEVRRTRRSGRDLPLTGDEFVARVQAAGPSTPDDASITHDGRQLDSKEAVVGWLAEVEADRSAAGTSRSMTPDLDHS